MKTESIELIDLVDYEGNIKKTGIPRHEIDMYPYLYLPIVIVVIFNMNGKVLVHKRSLAKTVNPGDIDHTCGGINSGEKPEEAALREAREETGVSYINNLEIVTQGINIYNRYRYLLAGWSNDKPKVSNTMEVEWTKYININQLRAMRSSGEFRFVDEFFNDLDLVCSIRLKKFKIP